MERKYFGTDGIRGRVGQYPITPEFVLKLGWAVGRALARQGGGKVVIGKDTRVSGYMFEAALEAGFSAAGVGSLMVGPLPTPAIAYLARALHAQAGIVISASHNPYHDNGVKFFSSEGLKLPDAVEQEIETIMDRPMETVDSECLGKARRMEDARGRYIEFCKSTVVNSLRLDGLKIVLDCANGATYQTAPQVFEELGATVIPTGVDPDGFNINTDCGSTHPDYLQRRVLYEHADLGIAFDGDGDRVLMVDHKGELVDGDELLYIIAADRRAQGESVPGVVGTLMTNLGLERALTAKGMKLHRTKVGDRYVMERLKAEGLTLGGENSGHILCLDRTTTGDGTVSALQVLAALQASGRDLRDFRNEVGLYPQVMVNVNITEKVDLADYPAIAEGVRAAEAALAGRGRVLLRPSGTEPVVRVMVEGEDEGLARKTAEALAAVVRETLAG